MDLEKMRSFQEFIDLLNTNGRTAQGQDLSLMGWYIDGLERQLEAVTQELHDVKAELAAATEQQTQHKPALTKLVEALQEKVGQVRQALSNFKDKIVSCAKDAAARFMDAGVSALDNAVAAMGLKQGMEHLQENLQEAVTGARAVVERGEQVGQELRSAGSHLRNAARAAAGKDIPEPNVSQEGRFQAAVLAPMRGTCKVLSGLNNAALAAIGTAERLEQAADVAREHQAERAAHRPGRRLAKKSSVRQALKDKRAEMSRASVPSPEREKKPQEAAL